MGRIFPEEERRDDADKRTAIILALFGGIFGIHKFYLGEYKEGIAQVLLFWTGIPLLLGVIDSVRYYLTDDWSEFLDNKTKHEARVDKKQRKKEMKEKQKKRWRENHNYILVDKYKDYDSGVLKIEEWTKGSSTVDGNIGLEGQSKGKSAGLNIGGFSASRTKSSVSASGDISAKISNNSYEASIESLAMDDNEMTISTNDIQFDIEFTEIEKVYSLDDGFVVQALTNTFRMEGLGDSRIIGSDDNTTVNAAIGHIQRQIEEIQNTAISQQSDTKSESESVSNSDESSRLKELKELHNEEIITDEEFKSKKEELLDDL